MRMESRISVMVTVPWVLVSTQNASVWMWTACPAAPWLAAGCPLPTAWSTPITVPAAIAATAATAAARRPIRAALAGGRPRPARAAAARAFSMSRLKCGIAGKAGWLSALSMRRLQMRVGRGLAAGGIQQALQTGAGARQPDAGRVGVHAQHRPGLRRGQPVAADQPQQFPVLRPQRRHGGGQPGREPGRVDRGLDRLGLIRIQRSEPLQTMDQPLPAGEGPALVRKHAAGDAEQPRDGVTAVIPEPRRRTQRGQERLADQVCDVVGVGAPRDRVAKHPGLVAAVETAERLGIPPGRSRQQVRVGLIHTYYLPAPGPAFQPGPPVRKDAERPNR